MDLVTDIETAVEEYVRPGDAINFRMGYQFSFAGIYELLRQYWDRDLAGDERFTLVGISTGVWAGSLIQADAVDRLVSAFWGLGYPSPRPHPVIRDRLVAGDVDLEHWTYLTLVQRMRAGAMGHPFVPTNSLDGSSIGPDAGTATVDDPFGTGEATVVSPLEPDISFVHGLVADSAGNTITAPIRSDGAWGSFASDRVVVTVEEVVDESVIERHSDGTTIPGYAVDAVVESPFGAHPYPIYNPASVGSVADYDYDREFLLSFREASRDPETLERWIEEWVLDSDRTEYLRSLGESRLRSLTARTWRPGSQTDALAGLAGEPSAEASSPSDRERMIVRAARLVAERVDDGDHGVVFGGVGVSHLASWAYRELCDLEDRPARPLLVESGAYDFDPPRSDGYIFTPRALPSAKLIDDASFALGLVMETAASLAILTGAQVDRTGDVNSSRLGGEPFVGSGGANDALSTADEVILVVEASPNRLVYEVEFVTGPGRNVSTVCTQYGTLVKREGELQIESVFVPPGGSADDTLAAFEAAVGWDVGTATDVTERTWEPVGDDLVRILRGIDPAGDFRA